jgi:hypothetical protein
VLSIKVNTGGYGGGILEKQITVRSDDPRNPALLLTVSGAVEKFARIEPQQILLDGLQGQELSAGAEIVPVAGRPFRILESQAVNGRNIRFALEPARFGALDGYRLTVHNLQGEKGRYFDTIVLKTDHSAVRELRLRVLGNIQ